MTKQLSWADCLSRLAVGELILCVECPQPDPSCCPDYSCEAQLQRLQAHYYELIGKRRPVTISEGGTTVTYDYNPQTIAMLREEIRLLRLECNGRPGPMTIYARGSC